MSGIEPYLYGAIFIATILLVEGLFMLLRDSKASRHRAANRRARLHARGMTVENSLYKLKRQRLGHEGDEAKRTGPFVRPLLALDGLLDESGLMVSTGRFLLIMVFVIAAVLAALIALTEVPLPLSVLLAVCTGGGLPLLYLFRKKAVRLAKFGEQLPEGIDMIVRCLRAGHPIRSAFGMVATEMNDPIGTEFGILVDELTYGLDLEEALQNMERRNDLPDLHYFAVTINLQAGTGGNLAEILTNLSTVIRDRYRMYKKVRALSAEGRLSAIVIAFVPFFVVGIMWINKPEYYLEAAGHAAFPFIVGLAVVLYFVSMFAIHKIVNFRV